VYFCIYEYIISVDAVFSGKLVVLGEEVDLSDINT